jgi:alkylation response protein AidB-like acyl-CoA dehydrogenase
MEAVVLTIQTQLEEFVRIKSPQLPLPGSGDTWRRFTSLAEQASIDLSLGRLSEGHADALAILAEADRKPVDNAAYGVWASRSKSTRTVAERVSGGWQLRGAKEFCSGSGIVDRALVAAETSEGLMMFDVDVDQQVTSVVPDSWPSVGMAASHSETLEFGGPPIDDDDVIGSAEFYLERPGFWFGAIGVAACWYGGAVGVVNDLIKSLSPEPNDFVLADLGDCVSALETMRGALKCAAHGIDEDPDDRARAARFRALVTRQIVHAGALRVLERTASAGGARPLCLDANQSRRVADLFVYLSQHHGSSDAKELGRILTQARSWS